MARPDQAKLLKAMIVIGKHLGTVSDVRINFSLSDSATLTPETQRLLPHSLLTPEHVAKILKKSKKTLANHRSSGVGGPQFFKDGGKVYYRLEDILKYIEENVKLSTSEFTNPQNQVSPSTWSPHS